MNKAFRNYDFIYNQDAWETNSPEFVMTPNVGAYTNSGEFVSQASWL